MAVEIENHCEAGQIHPNELAAKWAAIVDDRVTPLPRRTLKGSVIRAQSSIPDGRVLVRDRNSPDDEIVADEEIVDLGEGNVFYTLAECDVEPREKCSSPAKLAFFVSDKPEVTTRADQTGKSLRELFCLPDNAKLFRDFEGREDETVELHTTVAFSDGPVFYSRQIKSTLDITVNARIFTELDGVKKHMTGLQIATLVYPEKPQDTRVWVVSQGGRELGLDQEIEIHGCEVFDVVRKKVDGGYEDSRVTRELDLVRSAGQAVSFVAASPSSLVIYHRLRTKPGSALSSTDVLVPIPDSYPGQMLDWAYLPEDSPLLGRVKGSPQEQRVNALGKTWRRVSYHPHNGGGAPPWNPALHGFHTYVGELTSWLYDAN